MASTPAEHDTMEDQIDELGDVYARCPTCDATELVALHVDGQQTEDWTDADEYEQRGGADAGPLPPKPWRDQDIDS